MAAETVTIPIPPGVWTDIIGAASEATIQVVGAPVLVFVGAAKPADSTLIGLQLNGMNDAFQLALKAGDKIYAKSVTSAGSTVVVIRQ